MIEIEQLFAILQRKYYSFSRDSQPLFARTCRGYEMAFHATQREIIKIALQKKITNLLLKITLLYITR